MVSDREPRGDRSLLVAAIFGLIITSGGIGAWLVTPLREPYAECQEAKSGDDSGTQGKPYKGDDRPRIAGVPGPIQRLTANNDPCHGSDNEKRDLAAQEAAAMWAFWMVTVSIIQVLLSGFGLWALIRTIRQGDENLRIARFSMESDRAWISQTSINAGMAFNSTVRIHKNGEITTRTMGRAITITLALKNSGATPALNIIAYSDIKFVPRDTGPPTFIVPSEVFEQSGGNIGPDIGFSAPYVFIADNDIERLTRREIDAYIFVLVLYRDIYSQKVRQTEICNHAHLSTWKPDPAQTGGVVPIFEYRGTSVHNTAT